MIDTHFKKIVDKYLDIVKSIGKLEISEEEQISKLKAKLSLFYGTILWVTIFNYPPEELEEEIRKDLEITRKIGGK